MLSKHEIIVVHRHDSLLLSCRASAEASTRLNQPCAHASLRACACTQADAALQASSLCWETPRYAAWSIGHIAGFHTSSS